MRIAEGRMVVTVKHAVPANRDGPKTAAAPHDGPMIAVGLRLTVTEKAGGNAEPVTETVSVYTPWLPLPDFTILPDVSRLTSAMPAVSPFDSFTDPFTMQRAMLAAHTAFWNSMTDAWVQAAIHMTNMLSNPRAGHQR